MVLTGLRHFMKVVQGIAFASFYTHRNSDTEILNGEEGSVVHLLPNVKLIAQSVHLIQ